MVQIVATDPDAGSNGDILYQLAGSYTREFEIDSVTGEVTTAVALDYETVSEPYVLTVIAQDNGKLYKAAP